MDKKVEPGISAGYSSVSKAYKIYLPQSNKVIINREVKFLESDSWARRMTRSLSSRRRMMM